MCACIKLASSGLKDFPKFGGTFLAKMQNSPSKFHNFSFQSSKFVFCHFSPLSFDSPQFSLPLTFHPFLPLVLTLI